MSRGVEAECRSDPPRIGAGRMDAPPGSALWALVEQGQPGQGALSPMLIDSHCHLDFPDFQAPARRARRRQGRGGRPHGHDLALTWRGPSAIGRLPRHTTPSSSRLERILTMLRPSRTSRWSGSSSSPVIRAASRSARPDSTTITTRARATFKNAVFRSDIAAARDTGLPLVIHARNADDDMIAILTDEMRAGRYDAVLHCFSSGQDLARIGVELGLYVSFSGIVTFKKSRGHPRIAARRSPRSHPHRDRCAVSRAGASSRADERTRLCGAYGGGSCRPFAVDSGRGRTDLTTENFYRLFGKPPLPMELPGARAAMSFQVTILGCGSSGRRPARRYRLGRMRPARTRRTGAAAARSWSRQPVAAGRPRS